MRRIAIVVAITSVVFASLAVVAHADYAVGYTAPGRWFAPGEGAGSVYDSICGRWVENDFSKNSAVWGLVTFIDPSGGWSATRQGYGWISTTPNAVHATKKMHCKNNTDRDIQGGCFGYWRPLLCA